jgi:hypothetical protein
VIVWLLTGLTRDEWIAFVACLAAATPFYLLTKKGRTRRPSPDMLLRAD